MIVSATLLAIAASAQAPESRSKTEFEAASIRVNPARTGFHFPAGESTSEGGPGSDNPGLYRCTNCTLATLIGKAFDIQDYQFPGRSSLLDNTFDVMARIPTGATREQFLAMMQTLLRDHFRLASHFTDKTLRGYHLVVAPTGSKTGSKLKESSDNAQVQQPNGNAAHTHSGLFVIGGSATYRGDHKTAAQLAQLISDQLGLPVDDQTGLTGQYDIALAWAGNGSSVHAGGGGNHVDGAWSGGGGGAGHGEHGPTGSAQSPLINESGPTLFEACKRNWD